MTKAEHASGADRRPVSFELSQLLPSALRLLSSSPYLSFWAVGFLTLTLFPVRRVAVLELLSL